MAKARYPGEIVPGRSAPGNRKPALLTWQRRPRLAYPAPTWRVTMGVTMQLQVPDLKARIARLEELAKGAADAAMTQEAKAALERLGKRP